MRSMVKIFILRQRSIGLGMSVGLYIGLSVGLSSEKKTMPCRILLQSHTDSIFGFLAQFHPYIDAISLFTMDIYDSNGALKIKTILKIKRNK